PVRARAQRHYRPEAGRAGTALPGQLRPADQPAQPHAAGRTAVAGDRPCAPPGRAARAAVPRPGPLQGHQRLARPCRRRPHPARHRRAPAGDRRLAAHGRPAQRRRVHGDAGRAGLAGPGRGHRARHHRAFEQPLLLEDHQEIAITPSIGISLYPQNAQTPSELLKQADTAMYQAKAAGRRTWMRYTEAMDVSIRQRATVSAALRKVLDRGELRLVFQPRLALAQSRIVGVEALLRWRGADNIEIPPAEFIPLAEERGLVLEIGEWVLREACLATAQWHRQGLPGLGVSVNVSALQLLRGDFPGVVKRVLEETGLPPGSLELEITETVVMANAQHTADKLRAFRDLGVN